MDISTVINADNDPTLPPLDWTFGNGDLQSGADLLTMVMLCLFVDRRAPPDYVTNDPRGYWGDSYNSQPAGSRLWMLYNSIISNASTLLKQATDYCNEALLPLTSYGIASSYTVVCTRIGANAMGITVQVFQPNIQTAQTFQFQTAWAGV
jgi:phage gp46-like protein